MNAISVQSLTAGYDQHMILQDVNVEIPEGKITVMIGPNGCGKSTLLKNIARIHKPKKGKILLYQEDMQKIHPKQIAKKMAILPQSPITPEGLLVKELVAYGRFPYQKPLGSLTKEDYEIMDWAMKETGVYDQREQYVENLSGGQRQRAWIAMALAQQGDVLVLDEPTTYLDISYQLEILELLKKLNQEKKQTIVMVLHELQLACRYGDHIIGMKDGKIIFEGHPNNVISEENLNKLYGINVQLHHDKIKNYPVIMDYHIG